MRMINRRYPGPNSGKQPDTAGPDQCSVAEEWLSVVAQQGESAICPGRNGNAILSGSAL